MNTTQFNLPVRLNPAMREGPRHYLMRLAQANGHAVKDIISYGITYGTAFPSWFDSAEFSDKQTAPLRAIQSHWEKSPESWLRSTGRVCPHCLKENRVDGTVGWELMFADVCVHHECWLVDTCNCGKLLKPYRSSIDSCDCGYELHALETRLAPINIVKLTRELVHKACQSEKTSEHTGSRWWFVSGLGLAELQTLIRVIGLFGDASVNHRKTGQFSANRLIDSWQITSIAAEAIIRWPEGFHEVLDCMYGRKDRSEFDESRRHIASMHMQLRTTLKDRSFDHVRTAFEDHLITRWPLLITRWNSRLTARKAVHRPWISVAQASQRANMSQQQIRKLVLTGKVVGDSKITLRGRSRVVVNAHSLAEYINGKPKHCDYDLRRAAHALGLPRMRLRRIVYRLFPAAIKGPDLVWRIPERDVLELAAYGATATELPFIDDGQPITTVLSAFKYLRLSENGLLWLLSNVRTKTQARPIYALRDKKCVGNWIFPIDLIHEANRHGELNDESAARDSITLPELAKRWRVKQEVIYRLANDGAFTVIRIPKSRYRGRVVSSQEVQNFEALYVPARDLAAQLATRSRWLIGQLREFDIEPAFGSATTRCRQVFYRRTPELSASMQTLYQRLFAMKALANSDGKTNSRITSLNEQAGEPS